MSIHVHSHNEHQDSYVDIDGCKSLRRIALLPEVNDTEAVLAEKEDGLPVNQHHCIDCIPLLHLVHLQMLYFLNLGYLLLSQQRLSAILNFAAN